MKAMIIFCLLVMSACSSPLAPPPKTTVRSISPEFQKQYPHCFLRFDEKPVWQIVEEAALKASIDPTLMMGLVMAESRCNTYAVGAAGDTGLGQVIADRWGRPSQAVLKNPYINMQWATSILADRFKKCKGNEHCALQAYNGNGAGYAEKVKARQALYKSWMK
jgi:soluble lytic murein transglycosylase-like protein